MSNAALNQFVHVWADCLLLSDIGERLTCRETEALAELFESLDHDGAAECLRQGHAQGDDEGDLPSHLALKGEVNE